ncbi:hypothetical protein LUW77_00055 [Streptomyces radiopugnans]|nr:hypothetical protein LUW77_00055 [Streptomyces radiopugnans]
MERKPPGVTHRPPGSRQRTSRIAHTDHPEPTEERAMSATDTDIAGWNSKALDEILSNDAGRPVLFTNARILTMDPLIGTMTGADILFVGSLIVAVGPSLFTAAEDDNAIVVDATGTTVVPAVVDTVALAQRPRRTLGVRRDADPGQHQRPAGAARRARRRRTERPGHAHLPARAGPRADRGLRTRAVGLAPTPPAGPPPPKRASLPHRT